MNKYYYHAGSQKTVDGEVRVYWSAKTRRSKAQAESEAVRIAREQGGKPVVEFWSREHGLRPGWDCAEGAYDVTAIEVPD